MGNQLGGGANIRFLSIEEACRTLQDETQTAPVDHLSIAEKEVTAESAKKLVEAFGNKNRLRRLDMIHKALGDDCAAVLAAGLHQIEELHLQDNQIGDEGAEKLGAALEQNSRLKKLSLGNNQIGDKGAKALADGLRKNTCLQTLDLAKNSIGDAGAKELAAVITSKADDAKSSALKELNLTWNSIGADGATALKQALEDNKNIQDLRVRNHLVDAEFATEFDELSKQRTAAAAPQTSENKNNPTPPAAVGAAGMAAMAQMLAAGAMSSGAKPTTTKDQSVAKPVPDGSNSEAGQKRTREEESSATNGVEPKQQKK